LSESGARGGAVVPHSAADQPLWAAASLSLRGGQVRGKVVDPAGTVRAFLPLVQCVESQTLALPPLGQNVAHSATVLRGPQGALFPSAGLYRIVVELRWNDRDGTRGLIADAT